VRITARNLTTCTGSQHDQKTFNIYQFSVSVGIADSRKLQHVRWRTTSKDKESGERSAHLSNMIATPPIKHRQRIQAILRHASGDKRFKILEVFMKRHQNRGDALIEVLHKAQELFGYLEEDLLYFVAAGLRLPPSRVYGVATFYHFFTLKPKGAHTCVVCLGTACYVKGSNEVLSAVERQAGIKVGETTEDGQLSLLTARCI